jgi:hypothetical protein
MVWADSSFTLGGADSAFERRGWESTLFAEDWPGDLALADPEALHEAHAHMLESCGGDCAVPGSQSVSPSCAFPDISHDSESTELDPEDLLFVSHWSHLAPRIVYTCSHGGTGVPLNASTRDLLFESPGKLHSSEHFAQMSVIKELDRHSRVKVGDRLASDGILESFTAWAAKQGLEASPAHPAISFFSGCSTGRPNTPFQARLFREGWICAYVSSTESVSPSPLSAGYRVQVNLGKFVGEGLPLGLAVRGLQASYLDQSRATLGYLFSSDVTHNMARNLLAFTIYGDPSIPILPAPDTSP